MKKFVDKFKTLNDENNFFIVLKIYHASQLYEVLGRKMSGVIVGLSVSKIVDVLVSYKV